MFFSPRHAFQSAFARCLAPIALLVGAANGTFAQTATPPAKGSRTPQSRDGGQSPSIGQWWQEIDTGPFISDTFLSARTGGVIALKGIAIKVGAERDATMIFDTELLAWRAGFNGTVILEGTPWNGTHGGNSHIPDGNGRLYFLNAAGLGFGVNGSWADGRDPKSGPLPHAVGRYRGLFRHGQQVVLHYTLAGIKVLELPALESAGEARILTRTLNIDATPDAALELLVRDAPPTPANAGLKAEAQVYLVGAPAGVTFERTTDGRMVVTIARGTPATRFKIVHAERALTPEVVRSIAAPADLTPLTRGGPKLFPVVFAVKGQLDPAAATKTYAVDVVPLPSENPWKSPTRFGGFDFFPDGKQIAASTWNGDVWVADGIDQDLERVRWRRFASGLFQTLGLKIVDGLVYTQGRDQITRLHDLNNDGEADYYECFNNDVRITEGFHEFSFDLQTDSAGNFYFSKAMPVNQGGRGFMPWTPHNGTVMKVSKDGSKLEVVAWGLRGPGGVGVSPDGVITTGENEGTWVPQCKITWTPPGKVTFNGVVPGRWENRLWAGPLPGAPTDYDRPLMWLPYHADNSSGSQVWVPENTKWDPRHAGEMLHLSYGKSSIFRVMKEEVNGVVQGGAYRLPIDVSAAVMRARFHPQNGHLYVMGFRGWQTNGRDAFQRVRYTGVTVPQPVGIHAHRNGLLVRFSAPLDPKTAEDPSRYSISKWNYVWSSQYGSGRFSIDQRDLAAEERAQTVTSKGAHNQIDTVTVGAAKLLDDGRSVFLYLPKMTPAMQMELKLDLTDPKGAPVRETIYSTVHEMAPEFKIAGLRWEDIPVVASTPSGEPGLVMTFDAETTDTVRVDQLALTVPAGGSPSVFIGGRGFGAAWHGNVIVPERDAYTFSLEGIGTASLQIDGTVIARGELPLLAQAPVTLTKGPHAIYASFRSPAQGEARVRLMWSTPQFTTEPVPAAVFRHLPGAELELWSKVRAGRELFTSSHCVKCHVPRGGVPVDATPELLTAAPSFQNLANRMDRGWIEKWITQPQGKCPTIAPQQAADIGAFLTTLKDAEWKPTLVPADAASIATGKALVEKLQLAYWIEPLTQVRQHTDGGLVERLLQPARHDPDTVFPDARLAMAEATSIAAYIRSHQPAAAGLGSAAPGNGNASVGATAFAASCVACHAAGSTQSALSSTLQAPAFEAISRSDWTVKGCVSETRGRAPDLRLTAAEKALLVTFRNSDRDVGLQSLRRFVPAEYVQSQMKALNCVECHSGKNKLPEIAFAGEKLDRDWLTALFAGKQPKTRPWLETRMPAFASRSTQLATGLAAKHGVAPETPSSSRKPDLIAIGEKLIGAEGFSCVACHDAGSRKALQVFEGQGPNLQVAGQRLRYDYYQRWMHFPQRITPTTIMPRYTKDRDVSLLDTPFGGNAAQQFEAIWQWMQSL